MDEINQPTKKIRAACTERVSTPGQKEDKTIDAQSATTEEYCRKKGYEIIDHYPDDGWSGSLTLRPEAERLIADARAGLFDVVVCASVDRMSRNSKYYWNIVDAIRETGVRVEYVQTPNMGEDDVLMENVLIGVAADERQRIARRFATGKRYKVAVRKLFMGHIPPYGFKYLRDKNDPNDSGHLEHDENKKKIVEMIFRWIGYENVSANEVIRRLAQMKIPSPRGNPAWTKATFLAMIKNEAYLGKFYYYRHESIKPKKYRQELAYRQNPKTGHRIRPKDQWVLVELPALRVVDDKTFQLVREALNRNRMFSKRNTKRQTLLGGGLIVCESCGGTYYAGSIHGRDNYHCGDKLRRFPFPRNCTAEIKSVSAPKIEKMVWNLLCKILKDPEFLIKQLEKNRDLFQKEKIDTLRDLELIGGQIADIEAQEKRLVLAVQKGQLRDDQILETSKNLNLNKAFLIGRRNELQIKLKDVELSDGARKDIKLFCAQISDSLDDVTFEEKQAIVRLVIKRIYCNGKRIRVRGYLPMRDDGGNDPEILLNPMQPSENENLGIIANKRLQSILRRRTSKRPGRITTLRSRSDTFLRQNR